MSEFFQEAYRKARSRYSQEQWLALAPAQITHAIYQEMREMDAAARPPEPDPPPPSHRRGKREPDPPATD